MDRRGSRPFAAVVVALALGAAACVQPPATGTPPQGVDDLPRDPDVDTLVFSTVIDGLAAPTDVAFAPDGRVFVGEKSGLIRTYDSVEDPTPTVTADLTDPVRDVGEHGLMGITVDNDYPNRPYLYIAYAWDITGLWGDDCAASYQINGCVTGARVARVTVDAQGVMVGSPLTLVEDRWCYQFGSHSIGSVEMMDDGSLLVSSGEGANWAGTDYGQYGGQQLSPPVDDLTPVNPCGDPPGGVGVASPADISEGGSLRSQDLLTGDDPLSWDGAIARIHPDTGEAMPDNPLVGVGSTDDDGLIAHGLRNPTRFTVRPGTDQVFIGNVGQSYAEEIDVVSTQGPVRNFGWPCREGDRVHLPFDTLGNTICTDLLDAPGAPSVLTDPAFFYTRTNTGAAITGVRFVPEGHYPQDLVGDLVFVDYVIGNVYAVEFDAFGRWTGVPPEPVAYRTGIVSLVTGNDGYIYAVDIARGTVERLVDGDSAPVARIAAGPTEGPVPLEVSLDASDSEQPGGGNLTFAWDLDDDGAFDDASGPTASLTLHDEVNRVVSVQVTNEAGATTVASTTLYPGNTAPVLDVEVTSPLPWTAGGPIEFGATATDAEDGVLDGASVQWQTFLRHCYLPTDCHSHPQASGTGTSGSTEGPSHGYPSYLQLVVTATDSRGQSVEERIDLQPATATVEVTSTVPGAKVSIGEYTRTAPFVETVILGDTIDISVPGTQVIGGQTYAFGSWSDGGAASHQIDITGDLSLQLTLVQ